MPAQDRSGEARQIAETLFQAPVHLQRLTGGLVHFVYLATTHDRRERVIVKIRGNHYAELPAISCEPAAIQREATALRLLDGVPALQGLVPRLLYADPVRGHLAMTEVAPGGCSLAEILEDHQRIPPGIAGLIGSLLGLCHTATADLRPDPEDEPFFERELSLKLLRHHQPVVDWVANGLLREPRAFVLGDRSPKNVMVGSSGMISFIDFDNAHFGSRLFELGYAAAHILLHGAVVGHDLASLHSEFLSGYGSCSRAIDEPLYAACIAGVLLYRVDNSVIPYRFRLGTAGRERLTASLLGVLSKPRELAVNSLLEALVAAARALP